MSIANISIVGNLVRAPEQIYFASGKTKTTIVVAVNVPSRTKGADNADFYRVEAWGKLGELAANYLAKGNQITATGRLILEKWTDREGRDRMTPTIRADQIVFPSRRDTASRAAPASGEQEFADTGETDNQTVVPLNAAANVFNSQSAVTSSSSADIASIAQPIPLMAEGNQAQTA